MVSSAVPLEAIVTRRAFLFAPFLLPMQAAPASVHVRGVLAADNGSGDGYYALCGEKACHPVDAIAISVHPKGFFAADFAAMAGRQVQVSIFPVPA